MTQARLVAAVTVLMLASAAQAHPKLILATPAANASVDGRGDISLKFSEGLVGQFSGMSITMTAMPGMAMTTPMAVGVTTALAADGKTLVGRPRAPLSTGTYTLAWHAVSTDTHRIEGSYGFKVK